MLAAYAADHRIRFRDDASNALLHIPRNRIRHKLLPLLRKQFQPALDRTLPRVMEIIGAEAEFVSRAAAEWLRQTGSNKVLRTDRREHSPGAIGSASFAELPTPVQRRCIQLQLRQLGLAGDFELVEQLRSKPNLPVPVRTEESAAAQCIFRDDKGRVMMCRSNAARFNKGDQGIDLATPSGHTIFDSVRIHWRISSKSGADFETNTCR